MKIDENFFRLGLKTFISALPDTEKELKILLNYMSIFNKSGQVSRFNIVGNNYVMSTLRKLELDNKLNIDDLVENRNQITKALDTGLFTSDIDLFINIVWAQVEDPNYPETNLKEDFEKANKLEDENLYDFMTIFYVSCRKTSLFDNANINEVKKAEALKRDMDDKTVISDYDSLKDFKKISKMDIDGFKTSDEVKKISNTIEEMFHELEGASFYPKEVNGDSTHVFSLKDVGHVENLSEKLKRENQKEYSFFDDIATYLEKTNKELHNLNDAFEEESKLMADDFEYHFNNPERVPKLMIKFSNSLNKFSTDYEAIRKENKKFRSKSLGMSLSLAKNNNQDYENLLDFFHDCKKYFAELSQFIETYVSMFIETNEIFPASEDDDYGKSVKIILKEYHRILDNLNFIKTEMNDLNEKFTKI